MIRSLVLAAVMVLASSGLSLVATTVSPPNIELSQTLHFLSPNGEDVVVEAGVYEVSSEDTNLILQPTAEGGDPPKLITAVPVEHSTQLETPASDTGPGEEGQYFIGLFFPDGSGLMASGTPSGIQPRGGPDVRDHRSGGSGSTKVPFPKFGQVGLIPPKSVPPTPSASSPTPTTPSAGNRPPGVKPLPGIVAKPPGPTITEQPSPSGSTPITIDCNTEECKKRLVAYLQEGGSTILLGNNVNMDLSNVYRDASGQSKSIVIKPGVTIIGTRSVRNPGSRLYIQPPPRRLDPVNGGVLCDPKEVPPPFFEIQGDNIKLLSFRLEGPYKDSTSCNDTLYKGIAMDSKVAIEIGNMELSGWSGFAVGIDDKENHLSLFKFNLIRIHDNFIHHNQHFGGWGYGVVLSHGAYALIEQNVFDFNRHAIAADGREGTGYFAHRNLVLKGGGTHRCEGICFDTHQFDMHGRENCGIGGHYNCGDAGEYMEITHNAFQFRKDNAFKLRGVPSGGAFVGHNVFAHGSLSQAVAENRPVVSERVSGDSKVKGSRIKYEGNRVGIDTFGQYGVCDFDGDGRDDLFLATGVTWWYSHSAKQPWVYLNTASETLSEVRLGHFDNDKKCDVFAVHDADWVISSGGTKAWRSLGTFNVPVNQLAVGNFYADSRTDLFRRAPDGQWSVISPGIQDWKLLGSSSYTLNQLRLGDFNGDGITDVLSPSNGQWSVSWGGTTKWERLNKKLTGDFSSLMIADVNGNGKDDVLKYLGIDSTNTAQPGYWLVSWDGRSDWANRGGAGAGNSLGFVGQFDTSPGADLLVIDAGSRIGQISSAGNGPFVRHSSFEY